MQQTDPVVLTARYIFPVTGPPLPHGRVTILGTQIVAVEPYSNQPVDLDLGAAAILPALVNAHTHLEFSDLDAPLGQSGMPLPKWIAAVVAKRRSATETLDPRAAVERGVREALTAGTGLIGEIGTTAWQAGGIDLGPLSATIFHEGLGLAQDQWTVRAEAIERQTATPLDQSSAGNEHQDSIRHGLSPHAPYSTHPDLVAALARLSAKRRLPLAMHLAESREELELLQTGAGPFRTLLAELGAWQPGAIPLQSRPLDYLRMLRPASRALVIHGNYLQQDEIAYLAEQRDTMSLVYCPRTHSYFQHDSYPLVELLEAGVRVAIGTDSCASNPDLDPLAELRHAARLHPSVSPVAILRLATQNAAAALGRQQTHGSLEPGRPAHLTVVPVPANLPGEPTELLMQSNQPVSGLMLHGRWHCEPAVV